MSACDIVHTQCNTTQTRSGHACPALLRAVPHKAGERPPRAALCSHSKIRQRHPQLSKKFRIAAAPRGVGQAAPRRQLSAPIHVTAHILYYITQVQTLIRVPAVLNAAQATAQPVPRARARPFCSLGRRLHRVARTQPCIVLPSVHSQR